jgi:glycerol-3-phosphate dehydrogenase (NAD(P)+)
VSAALREHASREHASREHGPPRAAVIGAGAWGTTFAKVLVDAGTPTMLWARRPEVAEEIDRRHENRDYLPGVALPPALGATSDPARALKGASLVALAVPGQALRETLAGLRDELAEGAVLVSLMKGVELGSAKRMSEVICEVARVPVERVAVVSGPNLAGEISTHQPTATVVACTDLEVAERVQCALRAPYFRPYTNHDVVGCELGGAVKNVIAIAVGIAEGLGFGDNSKASLITRGLAETARLGEALGASPVTFAGLAGLGDLVATCMSPLSRNRTVGIRLGRGESMAEIASASARGTAEGVNSCLAILELAQRHGVAVPITEHVVAVVHGGQAPREMVASIMSRDAGHERDHTGDG